MTLLPQTARPGDDMVEDGGPTDARPVIATGLLVLLVSFGALLLWSALVPLAGGVVAQGSVIVDGNRKAVQHLEGGIVAEILVRDGDRVRQDDVLVRLDAVTSRVTRDVLMGQYLAAQAVQARLHAERDRLDAIPFPPDLLADDPDRRRADLRANETEVFRARREALDGQLSIYEQRIRQLQEQIGGLRAQVEANDRQVTLIGEEIDGLRQLFDKGFASRTRLLELERRQADLNGERGSLEAEIARAGVAIGEARLQILQLRRSFEEKVASELQEVRQRLFDLEDRLKGANDVVERRDVTAPLDGIIVNSQIHTPRGVVQPGQVLMEIVPVNDRLIVEIMIPPGDIDVVAVGMEAEVRFSALSLRMVPILLGRVVQVSADVREDRQGRVFYTARVEVAEDQMKLLGDKELIPGMPAEVLVKSGERTVLEYLTRPLTDAFFHAFKEI